mmetsp:Transcript_47670/g.70571  ORF Transcript_47670/g.70571 Transcript_47670/m.70571 type:complete len:390 (-) Transcript_47670:188-1357(-)|eukprot:CAMPEP_0195529460 /NCGR_PEP_ID=MMETSP0794_2-20130614/31994_1 /TAXON_ID=515487 /ORGANISM="Stephanopyxis turris, Strain CCMP 815" /LENGTH=389 /DNA_ID=CAMNT_0040660767 /DNA_START=88 /DNA_END=1257 /DNA_ORIENTATION=-
MDGSGMQQPGAFGFGMIPGQQWGLGNGMPPGSNHGVIQQQMHGSPGEYPPQSGSYHPQNVGMQHQHQNHQHPQHPHQHQHQHPPGNGMEQPHGHSPVALNVNITSNVMDPLEAVLGVFPCARLRGMPFEASLEDVLVFFQGLVILDVVVLGRSDGRGSGEAFVVFANPMDFQMALQRDRQNMGRRYIEVFQGKRSEYYAAIVSQHEQKSSKSTKSYGERGEKSSSTNTSSVSWSAEKGPTPAQAMAMQNNDGTTGNANQSGGGKGKNKGLGSGSPNKNKQSNWTQGGSGDQPVPKEHTGYLRMRGLPFSSTEKDIAEFLKLYNPIEDSVVFSYRSDGRATGEGYVCFQSPEDSKAAMALNRQNMGTRYIELFISSKEEHRRMTNRAQAR